VLLRGLPVLVAACAVAAGCGGGDEPATTSSLPPGCEVSAIDPIVTRFLDAVTAGDPAGLKRVVAPRPNYLVHDGSGRHERRVHLTSKPAVLAYFARRHRLGERMRLISMRVAPGADANHVLVDLHLTRVANDFPRRGIVTRLATGAGRVDCVAETIDKLLIRGP
jgi:hypothetical protein